MARWPEIAWCQNRNLRNSPESDKPSVINTYCRVGKIRNFVFYKNIFVYMLVTVHIKKKFFPYYITVNVSFHYVSNHVLYFKQISGQPTNPATKETRRISGHVWCNPIKADVKQASWALWIIKSDDGLTCN